MHYVLRQFFTLGGSKIEFFKTSFFDIVSTQYDHPRYVQHVVGRIYVFFTLFRYWVGGGGAPKGLVHNLLMHFSLWTSQKSKFPKLTFYIL